VSGEQPGHNTDLINCTTILTMRVVVGIAGGLTHILPSDQLKAMLDGVIPLPGTG
jgi:ABC-type antimicrobial peptide transport system permease subunit